MIKEFIYDCAAIFHQLGVAALKDCDPAKKAMGPSHAHSLEQGIFVLLDRRLGRRRFPAPQTKDTLDCALLEGELASERLAACGSGISQSWPPKLLQTGICPLRRCKACGRMRMLRLRSIRIAPAGG